LNCEEARLREGWSPSAGLVRNGMYYQMLSRYFDRFPRERIRVFLYEELARDTRTVVRCAFRFLGVDESFIPDTSRRFATTGLVRNPFLRLVWTRDGGFAWVTRDLARPPMAPATRAALMERFRPDIVALQDLIGRDLSGWLTPPAAP
jgi:Sulfotransferase domain